MGLSEYGGYTSDVNRGVLPGFQSFTPPNSFFAPYYGYQGQLDTNRTQQNIASQAIGAQQNTMQSLAPAMFGAIGSLGMGGGGGYQTDYGAGIRPQQGQGQPQGQQQGFRGYAQPQQQQGMGGILDALIRALTQFRGGG